MFFQIPFSIQIMARNKFILGQKKNEIALLISCFYIETSRGKALAHESVALRNPRMDRSSEKEKSSRRNRDSIKDHRDRDRDVRDSRENRDLKHRSKEDDEDHRHHHSGGDKHRTEKRSSRDESKHRDADRHRSSGRGSKRERSHEREGSRDRGADDEVKREKEREREVSHDSHKRKERGESEDRSDGGEKRIRVSSERRERRRFEDKVEDVKESNGVERRERRKFEDKVKEEDLGGFADVKDVDFDKKNVKKEESEELGNAASNGSGSIENVSFQILPLLDCFCSICELELCLIGVP